MDILIGEEGDNEKFSPGQSATQEPRTHSLEYGNDVINMIDTPGIGDSRGVDQDKKNFDSILGHLAYVKEIHAICSLLKPNNSRLTVLFRFILEETFTSQATLSQLSDKNCLTLTSKGITCTALIVKHLDS